MRFFSRCRGHYGCIEIEGFAGTSFGGRVFLLQVWQRNFPTEPHHGVPLVFVAVGNFL